MNFEINLVPDVKEQLLKKLRMRNFIIVIVILVAAISAGVTAILGAAVGGQNLALSIQDNEILCRSKGSDEKGKCDEAKFGTAILKVKNVNQILTIQDQMNKISNLNNNKMLISRVFGILDVILPTGEDVVSMSELAIDLPNATLSFDAQGDSASNIDYRALEVFTKGLGLSYYDYGRYMRMDDNGSYKEIPSFCISETMKDGVLYGIYHKGKAGCESSPLSELRAGSETETKTETELEETDVNEDKITQNKREDIEIRRVYSTTADREKYKNTENIAGGKYYFESSCIKYDEAGTFDEKETRNLCKLMPEDVIIRDSSNASDATGSLVLRFSASLRISKEVFKFANKHMLIVGPSKQNVTDSYTQIRDMFTERAKDCSPGDNHYEECVKGNN